MPTNWMPLWLGVRVAAVATACALVPGLWLAYRLATREFSGRKTLLGVLFLLLATPAVILGWVLLRPEFPWQTGAATGAFAALPLIVLGARIAWTPLDREFGKAARSLGAAESRIFWRIVLPLGWRAALFATAVAFIRVLVEWTIVSRL